TLSSLTLQQPTSEPGGDRVVLPSLRYAYEGRSDEEFLLKTAGHLWLAGVGVEWARVQDRARRQRPAVTTHPVQRQRYWIESSKAKGYKTSKKNDAHEKLYGRISRPEQEDSNPIANIEKKKEVFMPEVQSPARLDSTRQHQILSALKSIITDLSGL